MAEINRSNKSINQFAVRHHRYDPETKHFKWFDVAVYDNERQMNKKLEELWADLEVRRAIGGVHPKEQFAGQISFPPGAHFPRSGLGLLIQTLRARLVNKFKNLFTE